MLPSLTPSTPPLAVGVVVVTASVGLVLSVAVVASVVAVVSAVLLEPVGVDAVLLVGSALGV